MELEDDLAQLYPVFLKIGEKYVPKAWKAWKDAEYICSDDYLKSRASIIAQQMDFLYLPGSHLPIKLSKEELQAAAHKAKVTAITHFGVALAAIAFKSGDWRLKD